MFEHTNQGFGSVRCAPVLTESPSARAVEAVREEYAEAIALFRHCAETHVPVSRELRRQVLTASLPHAAKRRRYRRRLLTIARERCPLACLHCEHLTGSTGTWRGCDASAPELFCDTYNRGAWESVSEIVADADEYGWL